MPDREAKVRNDLAASLSGTVITEFRLPLSSNGGGRQRCRKVDIYRKVGQNEYLYEVKHAPSYFYGIGQLLSYRALYNIDSYMVLVLYGTPWELRCYESECRKVLTTLRKYHKLCIRLKTMRI